MLTFAASHFSVSTQFTAVSDSYVAGYSHFKLCTEGMSFSVIFTSWLLVMLEKCLFYIYGARQEELKSITVLFRTM
jgi:hypothetical protein